MWTDVDEMTIPQVNALQKYWKTCPPVHLLVSWYLGYKPADEDKVDEQENEIIKDQFVNVVPADEFDKMLREAGVPWQTKE